MATASPHADRTASEARRPEAGSRAGGVSRAARGNDGSPTGAKPRRGFDAQHDSATGHLPGGRGRPAFKAEETTESGRAHARHRGSAANAVWPIRRSRVGGLRGAPSLRGGDSPQDFPLECKRQRAAPQARRRRHRAQQKKGAPLPKERRIEGSAARSARRRRRHRLQLFDHARLNEHASLLVFDRHVEYLREHRAP